MAVLGTFSSFTTARLAIYASQASLNVTGNNIANINTKGYTRQRMDLVSLYSYGSAKFKNIYNTNVGYGVLTNGATQLRDPFLDIRYRDENTKLEQSAEWLDGLTQMSRVLDEVNKTSENDGFGVIEAQLGNLKDALQKLANQESFQEPDTLVRAEAETLTKYFKQAAQELETIYDGKRLELDDAVKDVNKLLIDIRDLNDKIRTQSIYGDKALELRDARNLALDELSKFINIDVTYSMERIDQFTEIEKLTVTIADSKGADGKPIKLVDGIYAGQIRIPTKEPVLNPNADAMKILEAKDKARELAEIQDPFTGPAWQQKVEERKKEYGDAAREQVLAQNDPDSAYWTKRLAEVKEQLVAAAEEKAKRDNPIVDGDPVKTEQAQQAAVDAAKAAAEAEAEKQVAAEKQAGTDYWADRLEKVTEKLAKDLTKEMTKEAKAQAIKDNPIDENDPDSKAKQQEAINKAVADAEAAAKEKAAEDAKKQVEKEINDLADAEAAKAEKRAEREVKAEWAAEIDKTVEKMVEPEIEKYGKYLKTDGTTATNELYEKVTTADGLVVNKVDEKGNPVYRDDVMVYDNDKFIVQVEPLKDERDRLMIDPYTASKRSEVVELGDNVLSGKLQAIRELLTEEGEYASSQDLGKTAEKRLSDDPEAAIKRGIPYYRKALDTLARQIANQFNEMNQVPPEVAYQSNKTVVDANGDPTGGDPDNLQAGESVDYTFLGKDKNPLQVDGADVTKSRMDGLQEKMDDLRAKMDKYTVFPLDLTDKDGNPMLDKDGNPLVGADGKPVTYMASEDIAKEVEALQKQWDAANQELLACKQALQDNGLKDPLYEYYDGGVLFSNGGNNNDPSNITASNISVAVDWAEGPVRVLRSKQPDMYDNDGNVIPNSSRFDNITDIIDRYDKQLDYFAQEIQPDAEQPQAMFHGSFREVFTAISSKLGVDGKATTGKVMSYELMTLDLENDRQSVSGVDLNEEATSMMQFSKSYAAACKLLTTLDSMLDKLINGTI